jgi:polar amino acid transport system substrate-binding protein
VLEKDYPEDVPMGVIQRAGVLRVGVPYVAPWVVQDEGAFRGFGVDLGELVARRLQVRTEFTHATNKQLLDLVDEGRLDVAFPVTTITERLVRRHAVTHPYYIGHQRLLGPPGMASTADLAGVRVCSLVRPATEVRVRRLNPEAEEMKGCPLDLAPPEDPGDPEEPLTSLSWDVATGLDVNLMDLSYRIKQACPRDVQEDELCIPPDLSIQGDTLSTGGIGALVSSGSPPWLEFVNTVLYEAKLDGEWTEMAERWLTPYLGATPDVPGITIEEAAALFPTGD